MENLNTLNTQKEDVRVPLVFISYSHDSKEHKMWVLELAQKLAREGIDVKLDQWDLEFGDDVPKFMEKWVSQAERVLMVCTESYTRKVDEGKGGAGYEAMIVTGELINNLGTKKFIPIARQDSAAMVLPKCIGTRFAVNLSKNANFEEEFTKLVSQLRQAPPPTKPGLKIVDKSSAEFVPPKFLSREPSVAYREAMALAKSGDLSAWRKLIETEKVTASGYLTEWTNNVKVKMPSLKSELPEFVRGGLVGYQSLFAIAVAGIESEQPKFNQQGGLIYDLLEPKGWESGGNSLLAEFPQNPALVFHAISGAMCIYSGQTQLALDLATQRVADKYDRAKSGPLFLQHSLVAWPSGFDRDCVSTWSFLYALPETFPWISEAFGNATVFRESLCGYYALMSWLEFVDYVKSGKDMPVEVGQFRLDVPTLFLRYDDHARGLRRLMEGRRTLKEYSVSASVSVPIQSDQWKKWIGHAAYVVNSCFRLHWGVSGSAEWIHFVDDVHK